jgi:uncharacterized membrane protein YdbT with pleckstrin-like domain
MATQEILDIDKNEQIIIDIRRDPVGLYVIYTLGVLSVVALLLAMFFAIRFGGDIGLDLGEAVWGTLFGLVILLVSLFTYIGARVYKSNQLVVTNENIVQVLQFSLFNRQVSQLNLAKIQDVSADQVGIIQIYFDYGTIEIETAGEAANFKFPYAEDPNRIAKIIIEAHEDYIRRHPAGHNTYRI